jgi:alpha-L-fucosidase
MVKDKFSAPLATISDFVRTGDSWQCQLTKPVLLDSIVLQEALESGEAVERYRISIEPYTGGNDITVYEGSNIGHKAIASFPKVRTSSVRVEVIRSRQESQLKEIQLFA